MISSKNKPLVKEGEEHNQDFTTEQYCELLRIAKKKYKFVLYNEFPFETSFILWRHDCDISLNRALRLAIIEKEENVRSTFFINIHCEFYNILEKSQIDILKRILTIGHEIGLHFDASFYKITTELQLDNLIANEALLIEQIIGVKPTVFSFHNPTVFLLTCEKEKYGGLLNCYSRKFKKEVPYCSDSNGYWRFRRLRNVLEQATDSCLQVLTHPGWWQEKPMYPQQRIFRSVYGRADSTMQLYVSSLKKFGRNNLSGSSEILLFIKDLDSMEYELCYFLWNKGFYKTLYTELWCLLEQQITHLCKAFFINVWNIPLHEINTLFVNPNLSIDWLILFIKVFEISWFQATGVDEKIHKEWLTIKNALSHGRNSFEQTKLEKGCIYLCIAIETTAKWGEQQEKIHYNGISHLDIIGNLTKKNNYSDSFEMLDKQTEKIHKFNKKRWNVFKSNLLTK